MQLIPDAIELEHVPVVTCAYRQNWDQSFNLISLSGSDSSDRLRRRPPAPDSLPDNADDVSRPTPAEEYDPEYPALCI
jgi:hypothetical protein